MPIKLPKGFQRRKSSGNALEELPNPPEPSFRVFERPEGRKSFDGGNNYNNYKRMSLARPLSAGQFGEDHLFVDGRTRNNPSNRYVAGFQHGRRSMLKRMTGVAVEPIIQLPAMARMTIPRLRHVPVPRLHYLLQPTYLWTIDPPPMPKILIEYRHLRSQSQVRFLSKQVEEHSLLVERRLSRHRCLYLDLAKSLTIRNQTAMNRSIDQEQ